MRDVVKKTWFSRVTFLLIACMLVSVFCCVPLAEAQFSGGGGYSSGFEGPKARFFGVDFTANNQLITQEGMLGQHFLYASADDGSMLYDNSRASSKTFDTTLSFDADDAVRGAPNLKGQMTSIYLPKDTLSSGASWLPYNWMTRDQYVTNPIGDMINWTIGDSVYGMQKWLCHYSVALGAEWDGTLDFWGGMGEVPPPQTGINDNSYTDLDVWIKIDTRPTSYYANAQKTYFAIGKIQLADTINYKGTTLASGGLFSSNVVEPRSTVSINPEGQGGLLYIFDSAFGGAYKTENSEYSYRGQALNPGLFKDTSFIKVSLNRFGVYSGGNYVGGVGVPGSYWVKGDVAKITFDVVVFSIGEWKVQDVQDDPDGFGYFVRSDDTSGDLFSWLLSAETLAWLIPVAIIALVLLFAPWVLVLIVSIFRR
jgi:hypothetical protein